jgi:tetratricopeptide (TPR) repeat protein
MKKITVSLILSSVLWVGSVAAQTLADGQKFSRNEEFEKAEQVYSSLIAKKPKVGDNYYWAALNFLAKGDSLSALNMFNQGLAIAPTFPLNLVGKGHMELRKHNVQGAEAFFAQASMAKKKVRPLVNKEIARAYLLVEYGSPEQLKGYGARAIDYLKISNNDFEAKILLGDAMIINNPTNSSDAIQQYIVAGYDATTDPRPLMRQAKVYARANAGTLAISKLDEALALDVNYAPAYRQKAEVFSMLKERDSAVFYYEEYLRRNDNITARKFYVQNLYLGGDLDRCIIEGKNLLGKKSIPSIYGTIAYAIASKEKAKRRLADSALIDSGLNYFFKNYEELYVKPLNRSLIPSENFFKAVLTYRYGLTTTDTTARKMRTVESYNLMTMALIDTSKAGANTYQMAQKMYFDGKNYEQAYGILELKRKKQAGKLNSVDLFYAGRCLANIKRQREALNIFNELITQDTNYLSGYYLIATTWASLDPVDSTGNVTKAFERWMGKLDSAQLIKFKADRENAYRNMAYYAQKKKDYERASYYYGKVLELVPDDQVTIDVKKRFDDYLAKVKAKANKPKPTAAATPSASASPATDAAAGSTNAGATTGGNAAGTGATTPTTGGGK